MSYESSYEEDISKIIHIWYEKLNKKRGEK